MRTKRTKTTKKSATKKTAKAAPKLKEDLVVFAFRLTKAERDAIHKTAGPGKASRFVRHVAIAFAKEDEKAFRAVLKGAAESRT